VLRSSCSVRRIGGSDSHPDRLCFSSHRPPPFPSPHLMWTKIGGHPNREGISPNTITQHLDATDETHASETHKSSLWKTGVAGPKGPATVATEPASPRLS
jgi:hypothetical protein